MKISWNWLGEYVDLDGLTPQEVADRLTMTGTEVESVECVGEVYEPVVVGEVLSVDPHPLADKLVLCRVDTGGESLGIVCGARNMVAGDRVPVIPAGKRLPGGQKIKKGKIRGEVSEGMMCSAAELELGDDHSGILILGSDAPVGESIADYLDLRDTVLTLSITPNRGDCLSYVGIAREVAALFGRERTFPGALGGADPTADGEAGPVDALARVDIDDADGCPRYAGAVILDLRVGPSPPWMARRLEAIDQRPVNNLVDVTNYVMFETGQPLHAFDLDALAKDDQGRARILVRQALEGERMESIDHVVRGLELEDVVITDGAVPVAVAGVMGGVDTEVSEATRNLLLECAHFNPTRIRKSSRRLGMSTESSYRFERVVDPRGVPTVLRRTVELVLETQRWLGGAEPRVAAGIVDTVARRFEPTQLGLRPSRCRSLLGVGVGDDEIIALLESIDVPVIERGDDRLLIEVPSFRPDLEREVDLIEEVGRLYGLDKLESTLPRGRLGSEHQRREEAVALAQPIVSFERLVQQERVRDRLADAGLLEAVNYAFVAPRMIEAFKFDAADRRSRPVELANPLSEEWSVMRTSLLPGLMVNAHHNLMHQQRSLGLFEIGPIFLVSDDSETGVDEQQMLAALITGDRPTGDPGLAAAYDALDLKGVLLEIADELHVMLETVNADGAVAQLHPGVGAEVRVDGRSVGIFGQIHPDIAEAFEIDQPVFVLEIALDAVRAAKAVLPAFKPIPRFPAASRDLALVVGEEVSFGALEAAASSFPNPLVERLELSSIYRGDPIPVNKKSVAVSVTYRSASGSLTDAKIDAVHQRLVDHIRQQVGGELR